MKQLKRILIILAAISLSSCSCEYHLKKLTAKCGKFTTDTLLVHDTVVTKEVKTDTLFKYFQRDTVIIREGKLTMKYYYRDHDSTVYLQGKCASDTIYREIKVPYEKAEIEVNTFPKWLIWLLVGVGLAIALVLFSRK